MQQTDLKSASILFYLCSNSETLKQPEFIAAEPYNTIAEKGMKKFEIKKISQGSWMVSHNENPKFTCRFEQGKFNYSRTIAGLSDPTGDASEIQSLQKMEKWLSQYHKDKING